MRFGLEAGHAEKGWGKKRKKNNEKVLETVQVLLGGKLIVYRIAALQRC